MGWKIQKIAQWTGRVVGHASFVDESIYDIAERFHKDGGEVGDLVTAGKAGNVLMLGCGTKEIRWWAADYDTWHEELFPLIKRRGLRDEFSQALLNRINEEWEGYPCDWVKEMVWRGIVARPRHLIDALISVIGAEEIETQQTGPEETNRGSRFPQ